MATQRQKPIVVIYFLAHNGVYQSEIWESWREVSLAYLDNSIDIIFRVHSEPNPPFGTQFCAENAILNSRGKKIPFGKSAWCEPSLPWQYIKGLHFILQDPIIENSPKVKICLVSGSDIPFKNGVSVFTKKYFDNDNLCWINDFKNHSQWIAVTKPTAKILDRIFYDNEENFKNFLIRGIQTGGCPDENLINADKHSYFSIPDKNFLKDTLYKSQSKKCSVQDRLRPFLFRNSPVQFKDSFENQLNQIFLKNNKNRWSLKTTLLFCACYNYFSDYFTFRKVTTVPLQNSLNFFMENLWNPNKSLYERIVEFNNSLDNECMYITPMYNFGVLRKNVVNFKSKKPECPRYQNTRVDTQRARKVSEFRQSLNRYYKQQIKKLPASKLRQLDYDYNAIVSLINNGSF
jgi:hypothetical protein